MLIIGVIATLAATFHVVTSHSPRIRVALTRYCADTSTATTVTAEQWRAANPE